VRPHGQMRAFFFYCLLAVPILAWMGIVLPNFLYEPAVGFSAAMITTAVAISPVVGGDLSIFGEITPVVLAGSVIALMPKSQDSKYLAVGLAVGLAVVSYALFIHLSVFFSSGPGIGLLAASYDPIDAPQKVILNLVSNVRVMAIVVAASILGFKVKS
jgi:hypothetical protein